MRPLRLRLSPARKLLSTCGLGGARAVRLTLERRRAISRVEHAAGPQAPRSSCRRASSWHRPLGAHGSGCRGARARRDMRSDHGAQSRLPQSLAPEAPKVRSLPCSARALQAGRAPGFGPVPRPMRASHNMFFRIYIFATKEILHELHVTRGTSRVNLNRRDAVQEAPHHSGA